MAPKTVTCSVCSKEVSKRSTLCLKNGTRACRSHSETVVEVEELAQERKEVKQAEEKAAKETQEWRQRKQENMAKPHCFCCHHTGLLEELVGDPEVDRATGTLEAVPNCGSPLLTEKGKVRILHRIPWRVPYNTMRLHSDQIMVAQLCGVVVLCDKCAKQKKVDLQKLEEDKHQELIEGAAMIAALIDFTKET